MNPACRLCIINFCYMSRPYNRHPGDMINTNCYLLNVVRDSRVGAATCYGMDGPGIESADPSGRAI